MNSRGFTLIEMLMVFVIGSISMMALALPFVAERSFWGVGKRQTEAQRDAQLALRAIAHAARQDKTYSIGNNGASLQLINAAGANAGCFRGGPSFSSQLQWYPATCGTGTPTLLIDGNAKRSRVTNLAFTTVTANKLVQIQLTVTYNNRENEVLTTELFLRNG